MTLRTLAKGLATDTFLPEGHEPIRADAVDHQLMGAAGYLRGLPVESLPRDRAHETTEDAVVQFLFTQAGDVMVAANLARLARRYPDLSPDEQTVVRHLVGTWVNDA